MNEDDNVEIVRRGLENPADASVFSDDLVWHFTGQLPGLRSEYRGRDAFLSEFLGKTMEITGGTFAIEPLDVRAAGPELVVAHLRITMTVDGLARSGDDVVVYRVIDGKVAEAYDVPSRSIA